MSAHPSLPCRLCDEYPFYRPVCFKKMEQLIRPVLMLDHICFNNPKLAKLLTAIQSSISSNAWPTWKQRVNQARDFYFLSFQSSRDMRYNFLEIHFWASTCYANLGLRVYWDWYPNLWEKKTNGGHMIPVSKRRMGRIIIYFFWNFKNRKVVDYKINEFQKSIMLII